MKNVFYVAPNKSVWLVKPDKSFKKITCIEELDLKDKRLRSLLSAYPHLLTQFYSHIFVPNAHSYMCELFRGKVETQKPKSKPKERHNIRLNYGTRNPV